MKAGWRLALACLAASACGCGGSVDGPECPHAATQDALSYRVVVSPVATRLRRDLDFADLQRLHGAQAPTEGKLRGLTLVEHRLGIKTRIALRRPFFRRRACAWIESLTVDLTPGEVSIYVPKSYPPDSCASEQVLLHERQHEDIHRRLLDENAANVRLALSRAKWLPTRDAPLAVADRAEAEKRIEAMIDKVVDPVNEEFKRRLEREQAVIDSPESYLWTQRRCPDWK